MTEEEIRLIRELFGRLAAVERRSPPRDREAERAIGDLVARQPAAPYYMAQTILVQERALEAAEERIRALEHENARGRARTGPWDAPEPAGGRTPAPRGGFLAGAAETAMGVAGGVLLGSLLSGLILGDEAHAGEPGDDMTEPAPDEPAPDDAGGDGDDFGGFDFGDGF
jgi:hypothetical protein